MRFCQIVLIILCAAGIAAAQQQEPASTVSDTPRISNAGRFDGTWGVLLTCPDFKDAAGGAKGYTFRFLIQVKDGVLQGEHRKEGMPGWLKFTGQIQPDGTAEIQAHGLTGNPDFSVGKIPKNTAYDFRVKARFEGSRGTGRRIDVRPCDVDFFRQ